MDNTIHLLDSRCRPVAKKRSLQKNRYRYILQPRDVRFGVLAVNVSTPQQQVKTSTHLGPLTPARTFFLVDVLIIPGCDQFVNYQFEPKFPETLERYAINPKPSEEAVSGKIPR
jgi:hypothetical protein